MGRSWDGEFSAFYAARGRMLRRTAFLLCGDWHEAEDLVQAALVKVYLRWRRVRPEAVDAYTRKVLVTTFLSTRRRRSSGEIPVERVPEPVTHDGGRAGVEDRMVLENALWLLTPQQRVVLVLRFWEDRSVAETAQALEISEGAVKSHTSRAVQALRGLLGQSHEVARAMGRGGVRLAGG